MTDLRNYKEAIKDAIARERKADENWTWKINGISKDEIKVGWGYLDYCFEKESFKVKVVDEEEEVMISFHDHWGETKGLVMVGPKFWDDAKTVKDGIAIAIHALANMAHSLY